MVNRPVRHGPAPGAAWRVCLITPELPPYRVGGIGTYVAALADGLSRAGHVVEVVGCDLHPGEAVVGHTWGRSRSLPVGATLLGGRVPEAIRATVRWLVRHGTPGAWRLGPYVSALPVLAAAWSLRRFVLRHGHRFDVIEYPNWPGQAAWLPPARGRGLYVARLSTSSADIAGAAAQPTLALERRAVRRAAAVITHSRAMRQKGERLYGLPAGRTWVVPLGLPDAPVGCPPDDGRLHLVCVGRAEDRKGTDLLLTALGRVLPRHPAVTFRFVGTGLAAYLAARPVLAQVWSRLQADCPGRVIDCGRLPEAERDVVLGRSHWLIVPSRFESFGLVAVEGLRRGTPMVYAAAGGLDEVGGACPANRAVPPGDADALARTLDELCHRGPAFALARRPAARQTFEQCFSAAAMTRHTLAVYRSLLSLTIPPTVGHT